MWNASQFASIPTERFRFRYIRLRCSGSIEDTIEFYTSLGMTVEWQTEMTAASGDPNAARDVLALAYQFNSNEQSMYNVQLWFEKVGGWKHICRSSEAPHPSKMFYPSLNPQVIYVHFLSRLVGRLKGKGFQITASPVDISEVKICIARDPNGIEVRLIELSDLQLNEEATRKQVGLMGLSLIDVPWGDGRLWGDGEMTPATRLLTPIHRPLLQTKWYARLAYYAVPTAAASSAVRLYETLFSNFKVRGAFGRKMTTLDQVPDGNTSGRKGPLAIGAIRQAISHAVQPARQLVLSVSRSVTMWTPWARPKKFNALGQPSSLLVRVSGGG
ncbi:hypothetical protein BDK51DRAFT_47782 [Blyttiomyces helicus]|uniref:Glyoxalase/Bleomycin resistance protein/Dihydroxybiphenyl dioxygenase n=1 Tax=Blyttiomyces helicus TaxID=388810 RepID=A0A4P9W0W0_9FUNG|nr:hypothetical protein BDK51DRAFT_47782 [Blyttiomyces helicus]|eukprot:RKO84763.1 hypothetical protein BDK51DRAFT_47782 [Blyttiomyces helicus]